MYSQLSLIHCDYTGSFKTGPNWTDRWFNRHELRCIKIGNISCDFLLNSSIDGHLFLSPACSISALTLFDDELYAIHKLFSPFCYQIQCKSIETFGLAPINRLLFASRISAIFSYCFYFAQIGTMSLLSPNQSKRKITEQTSTNQSDQQYDYSMHWFNAKLTFWCCSISTFIHSW